MPVAPTPAVEVQITRHTPPDDLPQNLSVQETAAYLGLSTWSVYQLVHQGKIPHRRFGKTILIPKIALLLQVTP